MQTKTRQYSEAALLALLHSNKPAAFATLYELYAAQLFGLICQIVPSRRLAESVLMDTFVRIRRERSAFPYGSMHLFTWMAGIAIRAAHVVEPEADSQAAIPGRFLQAKTDLVATVEEY